MNFRIAVLVSGEGSNLQALIETVHGRDGIEIVGVVSSREGARGLERAEAAGIETAVFSLAEEPDRERRDGTLATWLEERGVELVVLAGFMELLTPAFIRRFAGRIVNVHPALLPAFGGKGMYGRRVHEAVLASGARESGATVHLVDEDYDRGAILGQARVPVRPTDDPDTLAARVLEVEHRLLPAAVLAAAAAGRPVPISEPVESRL